MICPDCRTPIVSMMFLDSRPVPEPYCERCCAAARPAERKAVQARPVTRPNAALRPVFSTRI
jgi:hypothetical protein